MPLYTDVSVHIWGLVYIKSFGISTYVVFEWTLKVPEQYHWGWSTKFTANFGKSWKLILSGYLPAQSQQ